MPSRTGAVFFSTYANGKWYFIICLRKIPSNFMELKGAGDDWE